MARPRGGTAWATAALLVLVVPAAGAAGTFTVDPNPLPSHGTATVTVSFETPVEEAELLACRASASGEVGACYRPGAMTGTEAGNWSAEVPPSGNLQGTPLVGLNATGRTGDGATVHAPGGGAAYTFVEVQETPTDTLPTPGVALGVAALAAAALARP